MPAALGEIPFPLRRYGARGGIALLRAAARGHGLRFRSGPTGRGVGWVLWSPTLAGRRGSPRRTARMGRPAWGSWFPGVSRSGAGALEPHAEYETVLFSSSEEGLNSGKGVAKQETGANGGAIANTQPDHFRRASAQKIEKAAVRE